MTARPGQDRPAADSRPSGERIAVTGLSMEYTSSNEPVRALDDATLSVEPGASLAVVGPSGCGKSTLLGLIGGLEVPTDGEVRVGDHVISEMAEAHRAALRRRVFGFVFQADNLQPFLTVSENVGLQSMLAGIDDEPAYRQGLLDALDIGSLAHRYPDRAVRWSASTGGGGPSPRARPGCHVGRRADRLPGPASSERVVELLLRCTGSRARRSWS